MWPQQHQVKQGYNFSPLLMYPSTRLLQYGKKQAVCIQPGIHLDP